MANKFYPTPSTTNYYINGYLIDDVFRIDFKRAQQHQPIYGYHSDKFDFVARGKELVTGQIVINYRYPGYLRNVIERGHISKNDLSAAVFNKNLQETPERS